MKRIGNSKEPTKKQIQDILANLHEKFPDVSFLIGMSVWHFSSENTEFSYKLYRGDTVENIYDGDSWPGLIKAYRRFINAI